MLHNGQPLAYWQANKGRFRALAEAARPHLCPPCTSVDIERLFSMAAHIIDDKRNQLTSMQRCSWWSRNLPFMIGTQRILSSVVVGLASFDLKHFVANCYILINILKRLRFLSSLHIQPYSYEYVNNGDSGVGALFDIQIVYFFDGVAWLNRRRCRFTLLVAFFDRTPEPCWTKMTTWNTSYPSTIAAPASSDGACVSLRQQAYTTLHISYTFH